MCFDSEERKALFQLLPVISLPCRIKFDFDLSVLKTLDWPYFLWDIVNHIFMSLFLCCFQVKARTAHLREGSGSYGFALVLSLSSLMCLLFLLFGSQLKTSAPTHPRPSLSWTQKQTCSFLLFVVVVCSFLNFIFPWCLQNDMIFRVELSSGWVWSGQKNEENKKLFLQAA